MKTFGNDIIEGIQSVYHQMMLKTYDGPDFSHSGCVPDFIYNNKYNVKVIFQNTSINRYRRDWSDVSLTIRNNDVFDHYLGYVNYHNMLFVRINSQNKKVFIYKYGSVRPSKKYDCDGSYYVMYGSGVCMKYNDNKDIYNIIGKGLRTLCNN